MDGRLTVSRTLARHTHRSPLPCLLHLLAERYLQLIRWPVDRKILQVYRHLQLLGLARLQALDTKCYP